MRKTKPSADTPLMLEETSSSGLTSWSLGASTLTIPADADPDKVRAAKLSAYCETAWRMGCHALSYALAQHLPHFAMSRELFAKEMAGRHGDEQTIPPSSQHPFNYPNQCLERYDALKVQADALEVSTFTPAQFIERINRGECKGFSLALQHEHQTLYRQMAVDLEAGRTTASFVGGPGATMPQARQWIAEQRTEAEMGVLTDGAICGINLGNRNTTLIAAMNAVERASEPLDQPQNAPER